MLATDILWLITARSGSRSIQHKNIRPLQDMPLLAYRVKTALTLSEAKDVWLSTDSDEYATIGKSFGVTVPFLRPDELSSDTAGSGDVVLHAMQFAEEQGLSYKYIGLLEPTSPFVYYEDILKALQKLRSEPEAEAIVAVKEIGTNSFFVQDEAPYLTELAARLENMRSSNRQNFSRQVTPSGGFYISDWTAFKKNRTFYSARTLSFLVPWECELEIDEPRDWNWAEFLVEKKIVDLNKVFAK